MKQVLSKLWSSPHPKTGWLLNPLWSSGQVIPSLRSAKKSDADGQEKLLVAEERLFAKDSSAPKRRSSHL